MWMAYSCTTSGDDGVVAELLFDEDNRPTYLPALFIGEPKLSEGGVLQPQVKVGRF